MSALTFSILLVTMLSTCSADIKANDYVYWKKADITAWHQYYPGRALEEERLTNTKAVAAVEAMTTGMQDSLRKVVQYQAQELETAQLMMDGTSAQGCVQGIASFMDDAIADEISAYEDCTADAIPKLQRIYNSWTKTNAKAQSAYQKAMVGIDNCKKTYPNKDSITRLQICVDSWNKNYFATAFGTLPKVFDSPSMKVFTDTVATCAQTAAQGVVAKGWKFISKLVQCAKISENLDWESYQNQVNQGFSDYLTQNNLIYQVNNAQKSYNDKVSEIEHQMISYYDLQKRALEKYVIESRGQTHYYNQLSNYLQKYFATVSSTSLDNPSNALCAAEANTALSDLVNTGSASALQCDQRIVDNTKSLIGAVNNNFTELNSVLPSIGNAAILSCFSKGYIFAEETIVQCFNLSLKNFTVNATDINANIIKDVDILQGYENTFFSSSSLPCGDSILSKVYLGAERALYNLERCLYINSGTKYSVTTPSPTDVLT